MKLKKSLIGLLIGIVLFYSCDPCNDCPTKTGEPTVLLKFLNYDSLVVMQDSLWVVDTLLVVNDSLTLINDLIDEGQNDLEEAQLSLENYIDLFTDLRPGQSDNSFRRQLLDIEDSLENVINVIESGEVHIPYVSIPEIDYINQYEDSIADFILPLAISASKSTYNFEITGNQLHQVILEYDLIDELTIDKVVRRSAQNITVFSHSFDSVSIPCDTLICVDGNTEITFVF